MIHLDTSFLIRALHPGSPEDRMLRDWVRVDEPLSISTIAWAEFLCGPLSETELELATQVVGRQSDFTADGFREYVKGQWKKYLPESETE